MKNQLNLVFSIVLISLFSVGCKKDSRTPVKGQNVEPPKFTVSSSTFKDGVDHSQHWGLKSPQVSCENAPKGTKIFLITVKDNTPSVKQHTYWTSFVKFGTEIKEERKSRNSKEWSTGDFNIP